MAISLRSTGEREGVNVSLLVPLVRKAELSRSENQILIDLLLNKQQGSSVGNSEWIEGRQDPVVKLKKQLAEKEKALQEEQEASQSFQNKLKELRSEFNAQRSQLNQNYRQIEETLVAKQNELKALTVRLQHITDTHGAEKQALTQQNQQAEAAFKTQIGQLHGQLQEQENVNSSLSADLQKLRESQITRDGENKILRDQISHLENQIRHLKESSDHAQELARQIEELHRIKTELELHAANASQREAALQYESDKLREEVDTLNEKCANYSELKNEASRLRSENEQLLVQTTNIKDLEVEAQQLQEENEHLVSQLSSYSQLEMEAQQLREENESLAAQVTAMTERPAAEGRENGDLLYTEEKQVSKEDTSHQENTVKQKELLIEKISDELKEKESLLEKLNSEINTYKTDISKLNEELELQRRKNNELRTKNWKVMEALSATEKSLELKVKESDKLVSEVSVNARTEQQKATKQLLQRIFPDVRIEENKEGMLNKLQNHVEQEEARWRQQLQMKETELESIREERDLLEQSLEQYQRTEEMQTKLKELQGKLQSEESEKRELENERLNLQLKTEQERNHDLAKEVVKLKSLVQIGQDSLSEEQKVVQQLQQQLDKLNVSKYRFSIPNPRIFK
ncbi:hypothetical protein C0J52_12872 [Blattella germanica]|nr:hypothetical protein C0J52_12872 [Blattella germanica]